MIVYWEYAFAENFLLDGLLLWLALKTSRGKIRARNLLFASAVGAAEAVVVPLVAFPVWAAYLAKIAGGALICLLAVHRGSKKTYLVCTAAFFLYTFALGGLLTAAYSFFGAEYAEGNGYLVESAPVALVFSLAGVFAIACVSGVKYLFRFRAVQKNLLRCTLTHGSRTVCWRGLADSGNCLIFRGKPVSVISPAAAFALFGREFPVAGRMSVRTVNGERETPVLECEKAVIYCGKEKNTIEHILFAVGDTGSKEYPIILHTALTEGDHGNAECAQSAPEQDRGQ